MAEQITAAGMRMPILDFILSPPSKNFPASGMMSYFNIAGKRLINTDVMDGLLFCFQRTIVKRIVRGGHCQTKLKRADPCKITLNQRHGNKPALVTKAAALHAGKSLSQR